MADPAWLLAWDAWQLSHSAENHGRCDAFNAAWKAALEEAAKAVSGVLVCRHCGNGTALDLSTRIRALKSEVPREG